MAGRMDDEEAGVFDAEEFVAECRVAFAAGGCTAVKEVVGRTMTRRSEIAAAFGQPAKASLSVMYSGQDVTILNAVWAPKMVYPAHDHRTWAVIGIYAGEEDNVFYRRTPTTIEPTAARDVRLGEVVVLGDEVIHHVENPLDHSFTGGIHVYGSDYLNNPRSLWDPDTLAEGPATFSQGQAIFARANEVNALSRPKAG
jgi:predicted metal-dependent enzyme (double-stranded beta helix superfamily)